MISPRNTEEEISHLRAILLSLSSKPISNVLLHREEKLHIPPRMCSIRKAIFAPHISVSTKEAIGRVCASPTVSCPPAVPIAVSGELITESVASTFEYYGIEEIDVIK